MKNTAKIVLVCFALSLVGVAKSKQYRPFVFNKKTQAIKVYPKIPGFWQCFKDVLVLSLIGVIGGLSTKASYNAGDKYTPYILAGGTALLAYLPLERLVRLANNYRKRFKPIMIIDKKGVFFKNERLPWNDIIGFSRELPDMPPAIYNNEKGTLGLLLVLYNLLSSMLHAYRYSYESLDILTTDGREIKLLNRDMGISIQKLQKLIRYIEEKKNASYEVMLQKLNNIFVPPKRKFA